MQEASGGAWLDSLTMQAIGPTYTSRYVYLSFTLGTKHTGSRRFPTAWPLTICGMVLQVEVLLTTSTMVYVEKHV